MIPAPPHVLEAVTPPGVTRENQGFTKSLCVCTSETRGKLPLQHPFWGSDVPGMYSDGPDTGPESPRHMQRNWLCLVIHTARRSGAPRDGGRTHQDLR